MPLASLLAVLKMVEKRLMAAKLEKERLARLRRLIGPKYCLLYTSLLLMVVSFLPFPTKLLAEFIRNPEAERVAVTFYGIVLMIVSILIYSLWKFAVKDKLVKIESSDDDIEVISKRLKPSLAAYIRCV